MYFQFWSSQANSSTLKWRRSQSLKCWRTFTPWRGCLPEILLKESSPVNATMHMRWVTIHLHSFFIPEVEWGEQSHVKATGKEAQHPLSRKLCEPKNRHSGEEQNLLPPSDIAAWVLSCPAHYSNSSKRADSGQSMHQARSEMSHFHIRLDSYHLTQILRVATIENISLKHKEFQAELTKQTSILQRLLVTKVY
jgi:hypothetical protein